ncbi:MAG: ATP-binding protein [Phycisphaerales bacterium]|nr:ATP-binding protein [Phycisphaerales bacterium]
MAPNDTRDHRDLPLNLVEAAGAAATRISDDVAHLERLALLGTLTASIAHELNNLLTPALGTTQVLAEAPDLSAPTRRKLDRVVHAIQSATQVSEAILGLARPTDPGHVASVRECLDQALCCIDPQGGSGTTKHGVTIESSVDRAMVAAIPPVALQQVFLNLILNALAALRDRKGRVSIHAGSLPSRQIRITVSDNGRGMPPSRLANLFRPFGASDRSGDPEPDGSRTPVGTGLGLSVCRHLLRQSRGDISVASQVDRGTTFTILLPMASIAISPPLPLSSPEDRSDRPNDATWRQGAA